MLRCVYLTLKSSVIKKSSTAREQIRVLKVFFLHQRICDISNYFWALMYLFTTFWLLCVYTRAISVLYVKLLVATAPYLRFSTVLSYVSATVVGLHVSHAVC